MARQQRGNPVETIYTDRRAEGGDPTHWSGSKARRVTQEAVARRAPPGAKVGSGYLAV